MINSIYNETQGEHPILKIAPSEIQLTVNKLGGKLTKTIIVKSSNSEVLLAGKWSVENHPDDPPHAANVHPWIHFKPAKLVNNQMTCVMSIQTELLEAAQVYERELCFSSHPSLPVYHIPITITTPQIQLSDSTLTFQANYSGEPLIESVTIENIAPHQISQVQWLVKPHPHDPPHTEQGHPWIFLKPKKLGFVQGCEIRIETQKLMSHKTYHREIICNSPNFPHPLTIKLEIKTASLAIYETYKLPYLAFLATICAFTVVSMLGVKQGINSERLLSGILGTVVVTLFLFLCLLPIDWILKKPKIYKSPHPLNKEVNHQDSLDNERLNSSEKKFLKHQLSFVINGLILVVAYSLIGLAFYGVLKTAHYLPSPLILFDFFAILQVSLIFSLFGLSFSFFRAIYRKGFSFLFAAINLFLSIGLGVTLGIGLSIGFHHSSLLLALNAISIPLLITLLYYPFKELFLLVKHYYLEQRHSIRP